MDDDLVDEAIERVEETINTWRERVRPLYPNVTPQELLDRASEALAADPVASAQHRADLELLIAADVFEFATRAPLH
jgi:hypothetical protein